MKNSKPASTDTRSSSLHIRLILDKGRKVFYKDPNVIGIRIGPARKGNTR